MLDLAKLFSLKRTVPGWVALQVNGEDALICRIVAGSELPRIVQARRIRRADLPAWRKDMVLSSCSAVALLAPGQYAILQLEAPVVPREEWTSALQWQVKDLLSFPVEGAVMDVLAIPTEQFAPGRQQQCFLVAAPTLDVQALATPLVDAGYALQAVDIPELAQRNIGALFEEENRALAFLAFDTSGALLTLSFHGELYAFRRIEVPLAHIASTDECRRQQTLDRVALETQRTLDAFDRQYSFMTVTRLVLAAPPAQFVALNEALANNLYVPIVAMDLASQLDLSAVPELLDPAVQLEFLPVIGAALRAMAA
ncbi:MAG: hypothetical protein PHT48_05755 [Dechloromonas sp.]|nr:hypothetical protein [Dechloromonas sp.]